MIIEDYFILNSSSISELQRAVIKSISAGYIPLGGVATETSYDQPIYLQAVIKYKDNG